MIVNIPWKVGTLGQVLQLVIDCCLVSCCSEESIYILQILKTTDAEGAYLKIVMKNCKRPEYESPTQSSHFGDS